MTRRELACAVADATGETVSTIQRLGFSLVEPQDLEPLVLDWDQLEAERLALFP